MEKKTYTKPQTEWIPTEQAAPLCTSEWIISGRGDNGFDMELEYGGIDTDGELDPD